MSRVKNITRNIKYGYLGIIAQVILGFISRTIFIWTLGNTYLGINGLYTNILGVLSLAELGIGTAMNYSLYEPVAKGNIEKIKSLMNLYKIAYRMIAGVVLIIGLLLAPFLKFIIRDPGNISIKELTIFYLIFLFNTVTTYFVAYKYSLTNAEQKNYIQTNIQLITNIVTICVQAIILIVFKDFMLYLLIGAFISLLQKIFTNIYLNKLYPYLLDRKISSLSEEEKEPIKKNIIALVYGKIGEISIYQTDNILISTFINVTTVGLLSNYNLLITSVSGFINIIFSSAISSFGNLIATESREKQYSMYKVYRFLAFWLYGFSTIAFIFLLSPFIKLWIGEKMLIENNVVYLIMLNYYIVGHAIVINHMKNASGTFIAVKYIPLFQSIVNLVVSVLMVKSIGLSGVFIGTICASLISTFNIPVVIYREVFAKKPFEYYKDSVLYLGILMSAIAIVGVANRVIVIDNRYLNFVKLTMLVLVVSNAIFYLFLRTRTEFRYILDLLKNKIFKRNQS